MYFGTQPCGDINRQKGAVDIAVKDNMHAGHRERMISRLKEQGSESFQSHELLEMMLYSSFKQCDTNPIAHRLIDRFGTLSGVFSASENELCEVEGVGRSTAQMIIVLRANIERMLSESVQKGEMLGTSGAVKDYCMGLFRFVDTEQLRMIFLDSEYCFMSQEIISTGALEQVRPDMMRLLEKAVQKRCPIVVMTHNHPRGSEMPSTEDKIMTRNLFNLLEKAGIYLADHVIVGMHGSLSMRENGILPDIWNDF